MIDRRQKRDSIAPLLTSEIIVLDDEAEDKRHEKARIAALMHEARIFFFTQAMLTSGI